MNTAVPLLTTSSMSQTSRTTFARDTANFLRAAIVAERLNAFIAERERRFSRRGGADDVKAFVDTLARNEGPESACELLDLVAKYADYDIVNFEIYKELSAPLNSM
ncbi:hypothetical protein B0G80_5295 [Paraburkholderia sp. BL6669N2]|uniref:hypothetical protein n=1 Tax=Paraburkholderia sp. BL6669N2 TaxID=1938807 RepID=UPI000E374936|nr:hypothetical protein [Paraburkholderia sp. BL6669N2]REG48977.1 hypothetical protein B0G80_5295 [Paraburkholderia sp. BL6669N2]